MSRVGQLLEDIKETQGMERWGTESEPGDLNSDQQEKGFYTQASEILSELKTTLLGDDESR